MLNNDKITPKQMSTIIISTLIGIGILSLPRGVVEEAGPDGWLLIILGAIGALGVSFIMIRLGALFPGQTAVEYSQTLLSMPVGIVVSFGFALYFIFFSAFEARVFAEILKQFLLYKTPTEVIVITMLLTSAYLVRCGIEVIGRVAEIVVPLILFPYIIVVLPIIPNMDLTNFLPFMKTPPLRILLGTTTVVTAYLGFETILLFYPFINKPRYTARAMFTGITTVMVFYLFTTVVNIAVFGVSEIKHLIWPAFTLLRIVDIPGAFVQNVHGVMMAIWVVSIFFTLSVFYFSGTLIVSKIIRVKDHSFLVLPLVSVIYFLALIPDNIAQVYDQLDALSMYLGIPYGFVIPIILFVIAKLRGFKGEKRRKDEKTINKSN